MLLPYERYAIDCIALVIHEKLNGFNLSFLGCIKLHVRNKQTKLLILCTEDLICFPHKAFLVLGTLFSAFNFLFFKAFVQV